LADHFRPVNLLALYVADASALQLAGFRVKFDVGFQFFGHTLFFGVNLYR
jgi:hypothetical protein